MFQWDSAIILPEKPLDLLCVGEILVDLISDSYQAEETGFHAYCGGSVSNLAANAGWLGVQVSLACASGKDALGDMLLRKLARTGVTQTCVQRSELPTSMVVLSRTAGTPVPAFYRGADCQLTYTPVLAETLAAAKFVHFSCWPISRQPARNTVERLLEDARREKTIISFDPNYHPGLYGQDKEPLRYVQEILSQVDIVKPSEDDAARIFGPGTAEQQVQRFLQCGAKLVILTLGKDGLLASNGWELIHMPSKADQVVDATGAGDAFWSGFYAAVVKGRTLRQCLEAALAVCAYKLRYCGAVIELPGLEELEERYCR